MNIVGIVRMIFTPIVFLIDFVKRATILVARIARKHLWVDDLDWAEAIVYGSMWALWLFFVGGIIAPLPFYIAGEIALRNNPNSIFGTIMAVLWLVSFIGGTITMEYQGWENYWDWGFIDEKPEDPDIKTAREELDKEFPDKGEYGL